MKNTIPALLACTVTLTGCGSEAIAYHVPQQKHMEKLGVLVTTRVFIDSNFSKQERLSIGKGIELWIGAANGMLEATPFTDLSGATICDNRVVFRAVEHDSSVIANYENKHKDADLLGLAYFNECKTSTVYMVVDRLVDTGALESVGAHEFGHAIGLEHVADPKSIMFPKYEWKSNEQNCVTLTDIDEFCTIYGCDTDETRYCTHGGSGT